jgi:hypothetical protein
MCQYKTVACILLLLSVFGFVLAAPVAIQEVREAHADAVGGRENVIIGPGKRGGGDDEPLMQSWEQQEKDMSSYWSTAPWRGSSSAPKYASGTRPNPSFSSGGREAPPLSTPGGIKAPWNPFAEDDTNLIQPGTSTAIQPGTSSEIQPASLSKAKSVSWNPSKEVILPWGGVSVEELQPGAKPPQLSITGAGLSQKPGGVDNLIQPGVSTEIQPASLRKSKSVSWPPTKPDVRPPSGDIPTQIPQPPLPLPSGPSGPPKSRFKKVVSKLIGKLKFKP